MREADNASGDEFPPAFDVNALSRMTLGTVQFGLDYGISNTSGQPAYETARDMIALAFSGGINCLDTAAMYGASEEVIGRALNELGIVNSVHVATKIRHLPPGLSAADADREVEMSIAASLFRLQLDRLPICLLHIEENFDYIESLIKMKDRGWVERIGVSTMTPSATAGIIASGLVDAVQVPASVLDHRFARQGVLQAARSKGVRVFARSVYLQGLLLMEDQATPDSLRSVIPVRRRLCAMAAEFGLSLKEMALRYILSLSSVSSVVVGVESFEQVRENLVMLRKGPLADEVIQAIDAAVPDLPEDLLMPSKWKTRS